MHGSPFHPSSSCSVCTQTECPMSEGDCPEATESERQLKGTRFSLVCMLVFLLPIVLAILGSLRYPEDATRGLLAGIAGFLIGALISAVFTRIARIEGVQSH